ncbi:hypothetical protein EJ08DRAFT_654297, partial [Tothia fuscella]
MTKQTNKRPTKAIQNQTLPSPPPFTPAPENLTPFLAALSKSSVYITHIDRTPQSLKKQVFAVPVLLNLAFLILLSWRAWVIIPHYFRMAVSTLGYQQNETTINISTLSTGQLVWTIFRRALTFGIDYFLITIIWKWPISFFFETPHNPVSWRWNIGFRNEEVIVRVSRNWDGADLVSGNKKGGQSPFFKTRILPALEMGFMLKTGYVMMDGSWDLDFGMMVQGAGLIDKQTLGLDDLDRKVFVWQPVGTADEGQWLIWDEKYYGKEKDVGPEEPEHEGTAENRQKIMQIQEKLIEMGKEALFYKWVELIQY